jgi:hypothetical protein
VTTALSEVDPFDLPDWLGEADVTWQARSGLRSGPQVEGTLHAEGHDHACDLLAVDEAYPTPVAPDEVRSRAHRAWRHGQVLLVDRDGRLTLAVPARGFDAELVLDALARLAKAVGASPEHFTALLRIGRDRR